MKRSTPILNHRISSKLLMFVLYACILSMVTATTSQARDVTLQWDPSTDSSVTGYKVNYNADSAAAPFSGTGSVQGASPIDAKKVVSTVVTGLDPAKSYYFAVSAYNAAGTVSGYSNIVSVLEAVAPTLSITAPSSNTTISGTVSVTANATDNVGVTKVEFYLNGVLKTSDTSTPYLYSLSTTGLASGTYTLLAKAYDAAGNVGQSSNVSVTVVNDTTAPVVSLTAPANNATVSGTITISANASDNVGVSNVEFYRNGVLLSATNVAPFNYAWNTSSVANGSYTLTAKAYDNTGNAATSANVLVTVNNAQAAPAGSIWSNTAVPSLVDSGPDGAVELGVKFRSDTAGFINSISFYKASTNTGIHIGNLWDNSGKLLASATFTNETASGWQQVNFATPVAIAANTVYVASYHTNVGHYSVDQSYFASKGVDNAPLHALANGVSGANSVYAYGTNSSFPNQSYLSSNYWVDVAFASTPAVITPPADTTAPVVAISSPTAGTSVIGTATVNATASDNVGVSKVEFYVNQVLQNTDTSSPYSFSWNTAALANGAYTLTAIAYDAAGNVGQSSAVSVTVNNPVVDVTVPVVAISAPLNGSTVSGAVTVSSTATDNVAVTKVEFSVNGTLQTTDTTAPYNFSWNTAPLVNGVYKLTAKAFDAAGNSATSSTVSVTVSNTVAAATATLWNATAVPGVVDSGPDGAVELGVKFRSDIAGFINSISFYKASTNTGSHVGNLWDNTGKLLATATFTNETASGWQQVKFATPVAISANTVYVASYHTNVGHYSVDQNYFTSKGVDNAPLHALANGVSGANSVYAYGTNSSFPSQSYLSSNYWVDVDFASSPAVITPPADTTAPAVAISSPATGTSVIGTVTVNATASDNVGVSKVEFYVNQVLQNTDTTSPYSFSWNTAALANGAYTLTAIAYDAAGNVGQSSAVSVTVNNPVIDVTVPVVAISAPLNGSTVSGAVTVSSTATDNVAVTKVEFYVNGTLQTTDTAAPYNFSWNTTSLVNGAYSLTAKAFDAAGNSATSSTATVTVSNPVIAATTTLWNASSAPVVKDGGADSPVELGVKIRSDVKGFITGIRFYKASTNTGTHVANLWTSTGTRLATATFTNETASGWQQVNFATPVAITANTVYVASYHANTGHYSADQNYFASKGVDNGSLHALANGVSGANSVYAYGTNSAFPNQSYLTTNYWVDVVFTP